LRSSLSASKAIWKIPYFHHPPFTAGPEYAPALEDLRHWVQLFQTSGVQVAFTGHENNFQVSERNSATGNVVYVVSSAGSELRDNNIASRLKGAGMALFANQRHFLTVELQEDTMRIWPMADRPVQVRGSDAKARPLPISISVK
jgi:hypothetical protein